MKNDRFVASAIVVSALILSSASSHADPLVLHGTGEGLSPGNADPNWNVELPGQVPLLPAISANDINGAWIAPTPPNTWISVVSLGAAPVGVYSYTTSFDIAPGFDPVTASIAGNWWADEPQPVNGIYLNGVLVSDFDGAFWFDPNPADAAFSISSGFVSGQNTLTFLVENTGGPSGTLIQNLAGSVRPTAAPDAGMSGLLLGISLAGLAGFRRRFDGSRR